MPNLKNQIASLADTFAAGILAAIRSASLEELNGSAPAKKRPGRPPRASGGGTSEGTPKPPRKASSKKKSGRLARRSPSDIEHVMGLITSALGKAGKGLRSEELQKVLKLSKKEIVRPIAEALAKKRITKKGQKRATTYFVK